MEKLTKKDIKGPDAFINLAERLAHEVLKQLKPISIALSVIVVFGVIWAGFGTYRASNERKAQLLLYVAEKSLNATEEKFAPPPAAEPPGKNGKNKKAEAPKVAAVKPTGQLDVDYKDVLPKLKEVVNQFPTSQAAVVAALDLARLYSEHGQNDRAIETMEKTVSSASDSTLKALALNRLALAYEAKGDCAKAIDQWQSIADDKNMSFYQGSSLIKAGLCFEKLKQKDKAKQAYEKAEALTTDPDSAKAAKKYLRVLSRTST